MACGSSRSHSASGCHCCAVSRLRVPASFRSLVAPPPRGGGTDRRGWGSAREVGGPVRRFAPVAGNITGGAAEIRAIELGALFRLHSDQRMHWSRQASSGTHRGAIRPRAPERMPVEIADHIKAGALFQPPAARQPSCTCGGAFGDQRIRGRPSRRRSTVAAKRPARIDHERECAHACLLSGAGLACAVRPGRSSSVRKGNSRHATQGWQDQAERGLPVR